MAQQALINAQHLYRRYDQHVAVRDLTLTLHRGEVLALLGPNGAGKTSTLQMLTGNLAPHGGQIIIDGIDLLEEPKPAKQRIGYLPEQPPLYRDMQVDEYLYYSARLHRLPRSELAGAVAQAKQRCGLDDVGKRLIGNLSMGYQQRVGLAQAIVHSPAVIILDEPTVGLDPIQMTEIRTLIRNLGDKHGVVLSTHILPEVQAVCDRVQIVVEGYTVYNEQLSALGKQSELSFVVAFEAPPPAEEVRSIPGIGQATALADNALQLCVDDSTAIQALLSTAVERGWRLNELTPQRDTLEQIFTDLVYRDGEQQQ